MTPTFLFRSEEHGPFESEDLGWKGLCKNLTVIHIAAAHDTILDPENTNAILRATAVDI